MPGASAELLPGLRAAVADSRAKAAATRAPQGRRASSRRRPTRSPGCWSTCRWPTSTGPSTTSCRPSDGRRRGRRARGSRCGSPGRTSTASSSSGSTRPSTPAGWRRCGGWSAPSRCSRPAVAALAGAGRRAVRRHPRPTCCGSPSRRGTRRPRRSRPPPRGRRRRRRRPRRRPGPAHEPAAGVPRRTSPTAGRPARCGRPLPGDDWPAAARPGRRGDATPPGAGRCSCVPDHRDVARVDAALTDGARRGPPRRADRRRRARPRATATSSPSPAAPRRIVRRHPRRRVRAGARPRPGGDLGRRRRPARRAAGALPPHPRGAAAARRARAARPRWSAASPARVEAEQLLRTGWAHEIAAAARRAARRGPTVAITGATDRERDATRAPRGCPRAAYDAVRAGLRRRAGAGADPAVRLRAEPGLRALPHAGPLRGLPGPLALAGADRPARLPLVRHRRPPTGPAPSAAHRGLRAPVLGDAAHRRGAGPGLPGRPGADLRRRPGAAPTVDGQPAIVVATPGAEPVGRGRLRRGRAARHLAAARPRRPARRRGGAAPLVQRRGAGPARAARRRRGRRPGAPRAAGAGALGPGRVRRARGGRAARGPPAAGVAAGHGHRRARARSTTR